MSLLNSTSKSRQLLQCLQSYMGFPTGLREPVEQQILDSNTTGRPARYPPALPPQSPKPEESHAPSHVGAGCFECSGTSGVSSWIRGFGFCMGASWQDVGIVCFLNLCPGIRTWTRREIVRSAVYMYTVILSSKFSTASPEQRLLNKEPQGFSGFTTS